MDIYALNVTAAQVRAAIRRKFEQNRYVTDSRAIDVLLLKGWQEYQETMNVWKQPDHVLGILLEDQGASRPPRTFLQKFYEGISISILVQIHIYGHWSHLLIGRDEDTVLPAASGTY